MFLVSSFRIFTAAIILSLLLIGCGGSEETVAEDEFLTDTGSSYEPLPEETPLEEEQPADDSMAQDGTAQEQPMDQQEVMPPIQQEGPSTDQLQSELDAIKTENMQLKEENMMLQESNKNLTTKVSDLEAANAALAAAKKKPEPVVTPTRTTPVAGKSSPQQVQQYEQAIAKTRSRNYRDAMSQLQTLLNAGIKEDYADNCHYWLGECSFQLRDYSQAIQHFQHVQAYKFSEKKDDAQMMIARSYEFLGDRAKARTEYQKLVDLYPTSEYVKRARTKLR